MDIPFGDEEPYEGEVAVICRPVQGRDATSIHTIHYIRVPVPLLPQQDRGGKVSGHGGISDGLPVVLELIILIHGAQTRHEYE